MFRILLLERFPLLKNVLIDMIDKCTKGQASFVDANNSDLEETITFNEPDFVFLDIKLLKEPVNLFCNRIRKQFPSLRFVLLSDDIHSFSNTLRLSSSIQGIIVKTSDEETVNTAIASVFNGTRYIDPHLSQYAQQEFEDDSKAAVRIRVSKREMEVLGLIIQENTTEEIAAKLFISPSTAETHRLHLMQKFSVKNTAGLVREALVGNYL